MSMKPFRYQHPATPNSNSGNARAKEIALRKPEAFQLKIELVDDQLNEVLVERDGRRSDLVNLPLYTYIHWGATSRHMRENAELISSVVQEISVACAMGESEDFSILTSTVRFPLQDKGKEKKTFCCNGGFAPDLVRKVLRFS